ncbi:MAG TPA: type II toxin-antitoxin system VapC family toxin [Caulobacteraceae bacterium]
MNGFLLDTSAFLILGLDDSLAASNSRKALGAAPRYVSQICAIEIAIKQSIGKLSLPTPFQTTFSGAFERMVDEFGADLLRLEMNHIEVLSRLPLRHRDPFDRLVIAQALAEGLTVVTRDRSFGLYDDLSVLEI